MDLSVIVVSYNSRSELDRSVGSVAQAAAGMTAETIVVDNASSDDSADYVSAAFPDVRLIRNADNRGFSRGCNQGFAASSGQYILFLNPDTHCPPGSLAALVDRLRGDRSSGAVGPRLVSEDGTPSPSCFRFHTLWRPTFHYPVLRRFGGERLAMIYPPDHTSLLAGGPVDWISGASLLARRSALEGIGCFDEAFFMYFEDTDLCHRLMAAGWTVLYAPDVDVVHHGARSSSSWSNMYVELQRSRLIYLAKQNGIPGRIVLRLLILAAALARSAAWITRFEFGRLPVEWRIARVAVAGPGKRER